MADMGWTRKINHAAKRTGCANEMRRRCKRCGSVCAIGKLCDRCRNEIKRGGEHDKYI